VGTAAEVLLEVGITEELLLEVGIVEKVLGVGIVVGVLEVGTAIGDLEVWIIEVLLAVGTAGVALLVAGTAEEEGFPTVGIAEVFLAAGAAVEVLAGEVQDLVDGTTEVPQREGDGTTGVPQREGDGTTGVILREAGGTTGVLRREGDGTTEEVGVDGLPVAVLPGGMIEDQAGVLAVVEVRDGILELVEGDGIAVVEEVLREPGVMTEGMHQGGTMGEVVVEVIGAAGVAGTGEEVLLHRAAAAGEIEGECQGQTLSRLRFCKETKYLRFIESPFSCAFSFPAPKTSKLADLLSHALTRNIVSLRISPVSTFLIPCC
jgi:hypothetical protein